MLDNRYSTLNNNVIFIIYKCKLTLRINLFFIKSFSFSSDITQ